MLGTGTALHTHSFEFHSVPGGEVGKGLIFKVRLRCLPLPKSQRYPVTDLELQPPSSGPYLVSLYLLGISKPCGSSPFWVLSSVIPCLSRGLVYLGMSTGLTGVPVF